MDQSSAGMNSTLRGSGHGGADRGTHGDATPVGALEEVHVDTVVIRIEPLAVERINVARMAEEVAARGRVRKRYFANALAGVGIYRAISRTRVISALHRR